MALRKIKNNWNFNKYAELNFAKKKNNARNELLRSLNPILKKYMDENNIMMIMNEKNITYRDLYNKKEVLIKEYGYWVEKKGYKQKI